MNFVESLNIYDVEAKQIPCIKGSGAPTTETAGAVGALYMDIDSGDMYKCIAAANGVYTWESCEAEYEYVAGKNKLNLATVTLNQGFNSVDPTLDAIVSSNWSMSDYIPVKPGQVLTFQAIYSNNTHTLRSMRHILAYDVGGKILEYKENTTTYTVCADAATIRFTFDTSFANDDAKPMLFEGDSVTEYEDYAPVKVYKVSSVAVENIIGLESLNKSIKKNSYHFRKVDSACDNYSNEVENVSVDNHASVDIIYGLYDELVEAYPEYVTKSLLGTVATETESLPIYRYDFTPPLPISSKITDLCKILYCSGIHGGETPPILVGFRFFKDLCKNWRTQDLLRTLRFNCHFTVIPLVNPYGFIHSTRQNENSVDLNRNFTKGWNNTNGLVMGDTNYPGSGPASETSTQLLEAMIADEYFDFGLDHHTYDSFANSSMAGYFVSCIERTQDISFAHLLAVWMSQKVIIDNTLVTDLSTSHFKTANLGDYDGYCYGAFPNGFCFENMNKWGSDEMEAVYDSQKFNAEVLGAVFYSAMVGYHTY